jgi:hypothetical protein
MFSNVVPKIKGKLSVRLLKEPHSISAESRANARAIPALLALFGATMAFIGLAQAHEITNYDGDSDQHRAAKDHQQSRDEQFGHG